MRERRRYVRWQIEKSAQCRFQERLLPCFLKDISLRGARICLGLKELNLDRTCELTFIIIDELEPINVSCDIVWHTKIDSHVELGLYFTLIRDKDRERIFRYVFEHFPQQILEKWWSEEKWEER